VKRLVLLGAGHAHLMVLREFARTPLPADAELVVISRSDWQYYSGMLPGLMAGHYSVDQCRVAVEPLVEAAGGRLVVDSAVALSAGRRRITLASGTTITYDLLSLDVGASNNLVTMEGLDGQILSVKPLEQFYQQWQAVCRQAASGVLRGVAVVGAGAAGVELVMAAAKALPATSTGGAGLCLIAGKRGLLPGFPARVRRTISVQLARLGIRVEYQRLRAEKGAAVLDNGRVLDVSTLIVATGAVPLDFLADSDLELDQQGFVLVNAVHRSLSHEDVFAAGDTCSRTDGILNRSGVHAVRAGPVLAHNLRCALSDGELRPFVPRRFVLYLLSCGEKRAIGCYGPLAFSGAWVWRLKDRIDRKFVAGLTRQ